MSSQRKKPQRYRVRSHEAFRTLEDHSPMESSATTPLGFLRLFYLRWPKSPRGGFEAVLTLDGAEIYAPGPIKVASFIREGE